MNELLVSVETPIVESPRVLQVRGIFDLPARATSRQDWRVHLPLDERTWHIGLIVGPSGCGKSTIARRLFADALQRQAALDDWPAERSILDAFPEGMPIKEVVSLLSSVGFSSPPAWLLPYHVLSTGQQFRARLARLLALASGGCEPPVLPFPAVMDEYTSVVDRTVAQIGSAALARTVRQRGQRFVAVTCHEDVEDWLQPDWVYRPAEERFAWRCLSARPELDLLVFRCRPEAWRLFHRHHYLSNRLAPGSICFLASWRDRPVAFSAWMHAMTRQGGKREHRTVTLPDYQGVGIGMALSGFCASVWKGLGLRATSTTTHPAFIAARLRSPDWRLVRRPALASSGEMRPGLHHATTRLTAGFEYIGPALEPGLARRMIGADMQLPLRPEVEARIVGAIHHGAHAHVAASLFGISRPRFAAWMRRGRRAGRGPCHDFYRLIDEARALARLNAETEIRQSDIRYWLRHGPGKEDWSAPGQPDQEDQSMLANLEFNRLVSQLLRELEAFPEARAALRQRFRTQPSPKPGDRPCAIDPKTKPCKPRD